MNSYICVLIIWWLTCGFLGFQIGNEKNRRMEGFLWGLLLGPLGVMAIGFMPTAYSRQCPACCLGIPKRATCCCHCGSVLAQPVQQQPQKSRDS